MGFHYPLQKVVDLKSNQRTQAEWVLSAAMGQLEHQRSSVLQLLEQVQMQQEELEQAAQSCSSIYKIKLLQEHLDFLNRQLAQNRLLLQQAEQKVEKSQSTLTYKMQDEKVWVKAKDKAWTKFTEFQLSQEQNQLDELAAVRHYRT